VLAKRLLEDGAEAAAADDDSAAPSRAGGRAADGKSYQEEQEELRAAFLGATGPDAEEDSEEEEGGFIQKKAKTEEQVRVFVCVCVGGLCFFCAADELHLWSEVEGAGRAHREPARDYTVIALLLSSDPHLPSGHERAMPLSRRRLSARWSTPLTSLSLSVLSAFSASIQLPDHSAVQRLTSGLL